jgi:cytochrome c-type biogenesis protein CcmH
MLRNLIRSAVMAGLLLTAPFACHAQVQPFADPVLEGRARALSKELRCVVCQNQSIDDSTAPLAMDLKALLRERLAAGDTDAAAKAFLVKRYGNFVLLKPPFQFNTLLLWIGPFLLLGGALFIARRFWANSTAAIATSATNEPAAHALTKDDERRLAAALSEQGR